MYSEVRPYSLDLHGSSFVPFEELPPDSYAPFLEAMIASVEGSKHTGREYYMICTIESDMSFIRPSYRVYDVHGSQFLVAFHISTLAMPRFANLSVGTMLSFKSPKKHWFLDGQIGIRVEKPDDVIHIPFGLNDLHQLNDYLLRNEKECRNCSAISQLRCTRCKVWYCSPECQKKDWTSGHREQCKIFMYLRQVNETAV